MSDNITKRVGLGTAYGFAKAGGYEGTVAEFTELLGNIAIDLARIENLSVTVTTLPAGSQATASLNGSVLSLGIPKGDKGDKGNTGDTGAPAGFGTVSATVDANIGTPSVEVTASGADTAKNFAFAFHNLKGQKGDKGDTGEVSEAELAEALEDFSANGTVANAEQLTTDIRANDQTPYLFRTAGGSVDIGDREYINGIVGGTVAWNQLAKQFIVNGSTFSVDGTVVTVAHNGESRAFFGVGVSDGVTYSYKPLENHKYFWNVNVTNITVSNLRFISFANGFSEQGAVIGFSTTGVHQGISKGVGNTTLYFNANISTPSTSTGDTFTFKDMMLIDLTQMFGSTIADYIYGLEQANAGAGVAWFRKYFPKPYYSYNAGELKSVSGLVSHDMTGFNQWDEEWELGALSTSTGEKADTTNSDIRSKNYIPCLPNTTYYIKCPKPVIIWGYDSAKVATQRYRFGGAGITFTTDNSTNFLRFCTYNDYGSTYNHDICINLSWDGSRDGEYEPYVKHSYPLDTDLTLRGIPKLDANNSLYYDGDTYEPDGTVTRKFNEIRLDSISEWDTYTLYDQRLFRCRINSLKTSGHEYDFLSNKFVRTSQPYAAMNNLEMRNYHFNSYNLEFFVDGITSVADFKAWLTTNNVTLCYYAEPTTETADPYTNPQIVDDFGTEEFVISNTVDVPIPVGHNTDYPINLKAKLEMAPNSPSQGNGDYIVRQTNGMNEYVPLVIEDALPTIPSTAGTYKLTVTVAEGSDPVLSWEAE